MMRLFSYGAMWVIGEWGYAKGRVNPETDSKSTSTTVTVDLLNNFIKFKR